MIIELKGISDGFMISESVVKKTFAINKKHYQVRQEFPHLCTW
jgi:hypothetical protein